MWPKAEAGALQNTLLVAQFELGTMPFFQFLCNSRCDLRLIFALAQFAFAKR